MNITINGERTELIKNTRLIDALNLFLSSSQQEMSFAVAVNSDFISKSQYVTTTLIDGDSVDVLFPIYGG